MQELGSAAEADLEVDQQEALPTVAATSSPISYCRQQRLISRQEGPGEANPSLKVVPFAVDPEVAYPYQEKDASGEEVLELAFAVVPMDA